MKKSGAFLVAWGAAALFAIACGSDDSGGTPASCANNPQSCSATQTCWLVDLNGKYACLEAPANKTEGTPCTNIVGTADCGPGLFCFPSSQRSPTGTCSPYCTNGACNNGGNCVQVRLASNPNAPAPKVCTPSGTGGTGGTAGAGGAGGSTGGSGGSGGSTGGSGGSTGGTGGSSGGTGGATGGAAGSSGGTPSDAGAD